METERSVHITGVIARNSGDKNGFTLVETLVALCIVTISALAILSLLWNTMDENKVVHLKVKAKEVAVQKIEELRALPQDAVAGYLGTGTTYISPVEYLTENGSATSDASALFRRTFSINEVPGVAVYPKPVIFTCVVQYTYKNRVRSCAFTTMGSF